MSHIHNQTLPEGTQLGVYEIKEASKIDTFDITYRAWNHHLKEWVEIQEYFPHDFAIRANDGLGVESKSPSDRENFEYGLKTFLDQAEILTQIEHPNIVKAENLLQFNGTAYLIMDYQEGVPLSKLVRSPATFAETELKFILVSILNALQKVHEYKIVHGGIQPATIILGKNGEPLLTDFAVARLAIAAHVAKPAGELAPGYAPPELNEHANEPGPATDFYALGATMYYCITHNQPTAAQSRIMALSKGEPDPMASLSGSPGTTYSAELLQAIDWMLRPEYNNRPHSATEILALLKSGPINDQAGPITSKQEAKDVANSSPIAKNPIWIGVMAGIVGLVIVGIWFGKKPSEISGDKVSTVTAQPLSQGDPGKITITSKTKEDQSVALSTTQSSQEYDPDKISERTTKEIDEPEKQPKQSDEEIRLGTSADDNQPQNGVIGESTSFPASKSVSKPAHKDEITTEQDSDRNQQLALIDKTLQQSKKQDLPKKPTDQGSIKGYLAAAKKAMKAVRFTTPSGDNAHKYYQMVLAMEPDNAEALAGRQKIVDRYARFIQKSRAEGKLDTAKRALQKAESVLPNDPKLQRIRAELAAGKE
ncbi:protein kinase domain-containing protein [Methyloglobulus sp.]|uniref:protein kinase domain-containing protein n=1 Tax=Methyloglobulus sp. TaxID=2518622 RepID=UPI003989D673